jgi:chromosome segregation ATPase
LEAWRKMQVVRGAGRGMTEDPDATIRRLRSELQRAQEDNENLRERLSDAEQLILELRAKIPTKRNQTAAPIADA